MQPIRGFVKQCCLLARNARVPLVDLYIAYILWCLKTGVPAQDQFTFLNLLERYGLKYRQRKNSGWLRGISVLPRYRVVT